MAQSGFFAMNKLPERTALGYIEEKEGWRTNIYTLPIVGASDGGAYTTVGDLAILWDAFWGHEILSKGMVHIYVEPCGKGSANLHYGHGIWIYDKEEDREEFIQGTDAGVSCYSSTNRATQVQVTVLSNTTDGAWSIFDDVQAAITE